ncbi:DUF1433 domain-containing protein [Bacillus pseudomycoides]|uniref:DUF1433 domain-containing protein n=1 Tax=Bacillus TaxID=1386 RepID=UPI0011A68423|nr:MULTISPECIES: DUF1433 domain-containing protein [Bacillus]MCX2827804.1 DUF1433 domain-containing protein [Bacillus sp. DHT2]MDR4916637.1 DUF1433 domain-containing protein [Bacillus pseudomycoides]
MKKIIIWFVSAVVLIAGGYFTMEYLNQKEKEEKVWKAQEARVEKYIRYNIQDVKSITFIEHKISPMGVPHIKGYINDNRELWFDAGLDDNDTFDRKLGRSGELGKLIKKPEKSVSEIEKEEKEKRKE